MPEPDEKSIEQGFESQGLGKFSTAATEIQESVGHLNERQLGAMVEDYLSKLEAAAQRGEIVAKNGRVYAPDAIDRQLHRLVGAVEDSEAELSESPSDIDPMAMVTRAGGLRDGIANLLKNEKTKNVLLDVLKSSLQAKQEGVARPLNPLASVFSAPSLREGGSLESWVVSAESMNGHERLVEEFQKDAGIEAVEDAPVIVSHIAPEVQASRPEQGEKNPRLEKLFAPVVKVEFPPSKVTGYDFMFQDDEKRNEALAQMEKEKLEREALLDPREKFVDDDTRDYSLQRLQAALQRDSGLRDLLRASGHDDASLEAVDALRTDPDLAYAVGTHFLDKLNKAIAQDPNDFGPRLIANGQKRTDALPMPVTTSSREYAAYLAWSKIAGFFNYKRESATDGVEYDANDRPIQSQHRAAADMLL